MATTKPEKKENGSYGKKPRKSSLGAWVSVRKILKNSVSMIGRYSIPTDCTMRNCRMAVFFMKGKLPFAIEKSGEHNKMYC